MLILSDKLLLDIQLMHTFMPNMIHKPWMVSNVQGLNLEILLFISDHAQTYLQPHYNNGVFGNVYLLAGQH